MRVHGKPLFLLADSQPLFRHSPSNPLLHVLRESLRVSEDNVTRAAYIGASNGDAVEFFDLFCAAMDNINLHESRMIRADFPDEDRSFLASADLILLAGGSIEAGWEILTSTGMDFLIAEAYFAAAVVIGVSAGAVHLGKGWFDVSRGDVSNGLKLVPYYIDVHREEDDWAELRGLVERKEEYARGFGIPSGGALICHTDMSLEAVRSPVIEFEKSEKQNKKVIANLLLPSREACGRPVESFSPVETSEVGLRESP